MTPEQIMTRDITPHNDSWIMEHSALEFVARAPSPSNCSAEDISGQKCSDEGVQTDHTSPSPKKSRRLWRRIFGANTSDILRRTPSNEFASSVYKAPNSVAKLDSAKKINLINHALTKHTRPAAGPIPLEHPKAEDEPKAKVKSAKSFKFVKGRSFTALDSFRSPNNRSRTLDDKAVEAVQAQKLEHPFEKLAVELGVSDILPVWENGIHLRLALRQKDNAAVVNAQVRLEKLPVVNRGEGDYQPILILEDVKSQSKRALMLDCSRVTSVDYSSVSFLKGAKCKTESEPIINCLLGAPQSAVDCPLGIHFVTVPIHNNEYGALVFLLKDEEEVNCVVKIVALLQTYTDVCGEQSILGRRAPL